MKSLRALALGACVAAMPLAFGAHAFAAQPAAGQSAQKVVLYNAFGQPVAVLTPVQQPEAPAPVFDLFRQIDADASTAMPDPFLRLVAQQDAMMRDMMAQMNRMATLPASAWQQGLPGDAGPGQVLISSFNSGGGGSCSETITYRLDGAGAQPQVAVRKVGDACGSAAPSTRYTLPAASEPGAAPGDIQGPRPGATSLLPGGKLTRIDYTHPVAPRPAPQRG